MTAANGPAVRPGQVWIDNDRRNTETRFVRVLEIVETRDPFKHHVVRKARCETWYDRVGAKSRSVLINVDRFRPTATGYRLHSDASSSPSEGTDKA